MSSRTKNVAKNFFLGGIAKIIMMVFPFITRTIFIKLLGEEYLGMGGLFSQILAVLNMSELGLSSVMVYSLYKPLADKDDREAASLLGFYNTMYKLIAGFILVVGLALIPFLQYLVDTPVPMSEIRIYYVLYLLNSAASYLFIWKSSLIEADQKVYIITASRTAFNIAMQVVQILILLLTHNFFLYLCAALVSTVLNNLYLSYRADKMYPHISGVKGEPLSREKRKQIFRDVKAMLAYKMGGVFLNQTDNIYISRMINTRTVGYYQSYQMLSTTLTSFASFFYQSMLHSVGDFNVNSSEKEKKDLFDEIGLIFSFVAVIITVGFVTMSSKIILLWLGERFVVDRWTVMAMSVNIYLPLILYPVWMFRRTTGLFRVTQNIMIYAGILNLILSYFLGKRMGLAGILLATSVSRLLTSFWFEPVALFKRIFPSSSVWSYFLDVAKYLAVSLICIYAFDYLSALLGLSGILGAVVEIIICGSLTLAVLLLFNITNPSLKKVTGMVLRLVRRR